MKVSNPHPPGAIAAHVQQILVIERYCVTTPFSLPLFANGMPTLLLVTGKGDIDGEPTSYLTLFGQTILPRNLTIRGDFTLVAYFFQPVALRTLFGISAHEVTDKPLPLELLNPRLATSLNDCLLHADSTADILKLLNEYVMGLVRRAQSLKSRDEYNARRALQAARQILSADLSGVPLSSVQQELCLTERTFQRLFKDTVGLAPNLYRKVCRFNAAFQQLNRGRFQKLSDIAFENGYADQSHYIRTFREFTGVTPNDYLKWATTGT